MLVFNSHLKDPLIIEKVSPNETMELKDPESNQMGKHWRGGTTQTSILNVQRPLKSLMSK